MRALRPAPDEVAARRPKQPVKAQKPQRQGPGPSKLSYRLSRTWAKPAVRSAVMVYLPLVLAGVLGWRIVSDDGMRQMAEAKIDAARDALMARPEFALKGVAITGGTDELRRKVQKTLALKPGTSSLAIDVAELRGRVEALGAVEAASVQLDPQGELRVHIEARHPAALFRTAEGELRIIDAGGAVIGPAESREAKPSLPLIVGPGGAEAVAEVLALMRAVPDLTPRVRAFVRVGERRWDVVLGGGMTVMLPGEGAGQALARVMALHYGEEILDRDIAVIDMRVPERPTLRLTPGAVEAYRLRQAVSAELGEDT